MSRLAHTRLDGMTRGAFLTRSVLAASAAYGTAAAGPALTRALAHAEHTAFSGGDAAIVDFALTLEKIEAAFVKSALDAQGLSAQARKLLEGIEKDDAAHSQTLTQLLAGIGGKASPAPQARVPRLESAAAALREMYELKSTAVSALNGAATRIVSRDVLSAVASIAQVEARHAGALGGPTEGPFDRVFSGADADEALHRLTS